MFPFYSQIDQLARYDDSWKKKEYESSFQAWSHRSPSEPHVHVSDVIRNHFQVLPLPPFGLLHLFEFLKTLRKRLNATRLNQSHPNSNEMKICLKELLVYFFN